MNSPKYITNYDDFISRKLNEQDEAAGGADPFAAPADTPPAAQAAPPIKKYEFVFIDEGKKKKNFPGGGYRQMFPSYEVKSDELEKWVTKHIKNEGKRDDVIEIISGEKSNITDEERALMRDFRKHVGVGHVAEKSREIEVIFDAKDNPMVEGSEMTITFIDTKK